MRCDLADLELAGHEFDGMGSAFTHTPSRDGDPPELFVFSTYVRKNGLFAVDEDVVFGVPDRLSGRDDLMDRTSWGVVAGAFGNEIAEGFIYADGFVLDPRFEPDAPLPAPHTLHHFSPTDDGVWQLEVDRPEPTFSPTWSDPEHSGPNPPSWNNLVRLFRGGPDDGCWDLLASPMRQIHPDATLEAEAALANLDREALAQVYGDAPAYATPVKLLEGNCGTGHWFKFTPAPCGENTDCVGAVVELVDDAGITHRRQVGGSTGTGGSSPLLPLHFGLGEATSALDLRIHQPGGETIHMAGPLEVDRHLDMRN